MNRTMLVAFLISSASSGVHAEDTLLPLTSTCTIAAAAQKGAPRLFLVSTKNGATKTTYLQVNGPTNLSGKLTDAQIKVEPFDQVNSSSNGLASNQGPSPFVRVVVTEGWNGLLNRVRKGEKLVVMAGNETISISLTGSGAAVNALEKCSR